MVSGPIAYFIVFDDLAKYLGLVFFLSSLKVFRITAIIKKVYKLIVP